MNAKSDIQRVQLENAAFALMSRMHVILRRLNERVTDIEYMRIDSKYCRYILDFSLRLPHEDLQKICAKLEEIYFGEDGLFIHTSPPTPLLTRFSTPEVGPIPVATAIKIEAKRTSQPETALIPRSDQNAIIDQTYIGRLR